MTVYPGRIDQQLDIKGSLTKDQTKTLAEENSGTGPQISTGTGDSFAFSSPTVTLTDAGASWTSADIGRFITIAGSTSPGNDGTFMIESVPSGTTLTYTNATGVTEAFAGTWTINDPYSLEDDLNFERTDRKLIKGTTNYYDDVPNYVRPSAIGTDVPANLTNIAGKTLDAFTEVRNVKQEDVKLRPTITDGDATLAISDETFTTTGFHFVADDLNSFITISGSTDADGTYRIKTVTDGQTLELDGLASLTSEGSITWKLESDLKGILSARNYADAVDRRGIPIADSGEYDQTNYEATFCEVIDPVTGGRPVDEAGNPLFARTYGDEKDPNNTGTNEATRFFAQLIYGANNGSATEEELEPIATRSGSAASVTDSSAAITGLSGMTEQDIGRYISIWNCATDGNQRHAEILTVVSASSVTVSGANFATDANDGSIEWQVSRHPGNWDFYNGDRYRLDEISETARRVTLIGGIQADAELTLDIAEVREFIGANDGDTTPALTNTGNYYPFSDIPNAADTSLEEIVNILNQEIGDRSYTSTLLTDGQTITASIEALGNAIDATSIVRTIERLSADIPKQSAHTLPGGLTYTLDGGDNGANMWVYWRKQLRDPGAVENGDDYEETSTTQITPFEKIPSGDHMNYFILQ